MKHHYLVLIGYVVVVALVFGRALIPGPNEMIFGDDIHRQYYFYREFFNTSVGQGIFPWWNPYLFGGEPFIANPVVNIWYPPTWLFSLLPLNIAYSWHIAFHVVWAMVGMYVLLGYLGHLGNLSRWTAGVIFGLSGFFMARTFAGHVDVIAAASWMPWVIATSTKYQASSIKESRKNLCIAVGVFALQLLAGYQTMAFFTGIAVGIFALSRSISQKNIRPLLFTLCSLLLGVCLAAIQILPASEFFSRSIRTFSFPYSWHSYGAWEWRSLLQLVNPFQFGNQYTYWGPPPNFIEHSAYVGIGGLILAFIGLIGPIRPISLIVFFGIWVSLGPNAPIDLQKLLWQTVPMYEYLRIPPRHLILVVFGLSGLAGVGFSRLPKSPRLLRSLIAGVIVLEMVLFARGFIEVKLVPEARHDRELITLLKSDTQPYRTLQNFGVWLDARNALDFDSTMMYGIYSATGYDPSILRSYFEYVSGGAGEKAVLSHDVQIPYITDGAILDRLNIKYILVPKVYDPFLGNTRYRVIREQKDYRVYENTTVKHRFYFDQPCGDVVIRSYTPNKIVLSTDTTCTANLLSSEVHYPGWHAYIDGKRVDITVSEGTFRTLFVPLGNHTIIYEYSPKIFVLGGIISLTTVIILYVVVRFWHIQRQSATMFLRSRNALEDLRRRLL